MSRSSVLYPNHAVILLSSGLGSRMNPLNERARFCHKLLEALPNGQLVIDYILDQLEGLVSFTVMNTYTSNTERSKDYYRDSRCKALRNHVGNRVHFVNDDQRFQGTACGAFSEEMKRLFSVHPNIDWIIIGSADHPFLYEKQYFREFMEFSQRVSEDTDSVVLVNRNSGRPERIGPCLVLPTEGRLIGMVEIEDINGVILNGEIQYRLAGSFSRPIFIPQRRLVESLDCHFPKSIGDYCAGAIAIKKEAYQSCILEEIHVKKNGEKDAISGPIGILLSRESIVRAMIVDNPWITGDANTKDELLQLWETYASGRSGQ